MYLRYIIVGTITVTLILLIIITQWLDSYIIDPLKKVINIFKNASERDTSLRIDTESKDEIGELGKCFNGYLDNIQEYQKYINDINLNLEQKVIDRTAKLKEALSQVKVLSGFLPICARCKKIRNDSGYWEQIESYIRDHSEAEFSHSICTECTKELYGDILEFDE